MRSRSALEGLVFEFDEAITAEIRGREICDSSPHIVALPWSTLQR